MRLRSRFLLFEVAAWLGRPLTVILQPMIIRLSKIGSLLGVFISAIAWVPALTEAQPVAPAVTVIKAARLLDGHGGPPWLRRWCA